MAPKRQCSSQTSSVKGVSTVFFEGPIGNQPDFEKEKILKVMVRSV